MTDEFDILALTPDDDRQGFSCGIDSLDRYLARQAGQDRRRHLANCFVAKRRGSSVIAGYFTLSATSLPVADLPADVARRLPPYYKLPTSLVGRLAVDLRFRGRGLGRALLVDAIRRSRKADPAVFAVVVDAIDAEAAAFYRRFQFTPFASRPLSLFLPITFLDRLKDELPK